MADDDHLLARLAEELAEAPDRGLPLPSRLCRSAARILHCDGGAITLAYTLVQRVTLTTTDGTARALEETQDVVGEGPGPDAYTTGAYSRLDLLDVDGPDPRWPLLETSSPTALAPVVVHALPMVHARAVIGVLTLYQRGVDRQIDLEAGLVLARLVGASLLAGAPTHQEAGHGPWAERAEVHQATGMVAAQLGIPQRDALALIRAHAYSHAQSVGSSARAVLTTALAFSASPTREIQST